MSNDIKKVVITGSEGQLGKCIMSCQKLFDDLDLDPQNSSSLDITDNIELDKFFRTNNDVSYCINCAAYTNVEQSEKEPEKAFRVNATGAKNLAEICKKHNIILVHISTDYIFDGNQKIPYTEKDIPNPINEYGKSKLKGELYIQEIISNYFIIRTSWLYSQFDNNFFTTILNKSNTENELTITTSETGTPTNANDLAKVILNIISKENIVYGVYNYSNHGHGTWYDFAEEILKNRDKQNAVNLKRTDNYPTLAKRPKYSVLSKKKIIEHLNVNVLDWKKSLKKLMTNKDGSCYIL